MTPQDNDGREWRPYEIATPIASTAATLPPPLARTAPAGSHRPLPVREDADVVLAGLQKRLAAAAIDIALWSLPFVFILKAVMQAYHLQAVGLPVSVSGIASKSVVAMLLWLALAIWNMVLMALHGKTVGKRFMGIRVVRSDGSPASFLRLLLLRGGVMTLLGSIAGRLVPFGGIVLWVTDVLFIFGEDRRTLHDRIADTIVVES